MTEDTAQLPKLKTTDEVAQALGVSPTALRVQRHRNQLPGALGFLVNGPVRYRVDDVVAYVEDQAHEQQQAVRESLA